MQSPLEDLTFMFQPIVGLAAGHAHWSEALIRWRLPDGTIRGPLDILPHWLAPARIDTFTRFTLLKGAKVLAAHPEVRLSVNLTPAQLQLPSTLLALEGMLPSVTERLYIEVVEGAAPESSTLSRQLRLLRELCGGIYLDDVTREDLGHRARLDAPVDGVKVDRSVVQAALHGRGEERAAAFKRANDDYSAIIVQALADRLVEATAEHLHRLVRTRYWGYAPDEALTAEQLIAEEYRGIRPAPGYPACPDHRPKLQIFSLLGATRAVGASLTEGLSMAPGSTVSGLYFSHPEARYFDVGRIGRDQVEDLAARTGTDLRELERWLAPRLDYTP